MKVILFWILIIPSIALLIIFGLLEFIGQIGEAGNHYLDEFEKWCFDRDKDL